MAAAESSIVGLIRCGGGGGAGYALLGLHFRRIRALAGSLLAL
jgi:hypothetical protein